MSHKTRQINNVRQMLQILCADVQVKQFFSWDTEIIQVRCRNVRCVRQTLREEDFNCYRSEKNWKNCIAMCPPVANWNLYSHVEDTIKKKGQKLCLPKYCALKKSRQQNNRWQHLVFFKFFFLMNCDSPEIKIFSKMCRKTALRMPISQFFPTIP